MQLRGRASGLIRAEGGLLPADLLERVRALDRKLPGLDEASYGLAKNERFGDAIARSWNKLTGAWATVTDELTKVPGSDPATTTTRERFLLPLFEELGYGRLSPTKSVEIDGKAYPVSHAFETVPLHLIGANVPLDRRSRGIVGAAGQSPHGLVQELLNRSPERLWGLVTNGRTLRILRDNASLVRQAYVEFDLEAIMAGEAYADFALLWHLAHRTRLEPRTADGADEGTTATQAGCYLERWSKVAEETGARARDRLRDGVQEAIEALGSGFLAHRDNVALRTALESGELTTQDYYRELLRLVYRLILLFVAEDRDLLLDPKAEPAIKDRYARFYSTARLRRLAERRKGSRHADLYAGVRVVITALGSDDGAPGIGLPPLGGFLFGSEACPHLDPAELANGDLLEAIRKLATIEERNVLRTVDYRNLGSEELGSIYESLLELHPELDTAAAAFKLTTAAGHERKTTGSYYTPSSLISVLLDSALDPVLAEAADKPSKEEAERAILELSVVDPAAGSGHFLVAAAHRIAKRLAQVRTEDEEPAPSAITTALRDVIGHCLYAVDINPMAVELCKVSLWLEALEPGKPLTFLDAHIKCGNSLLGTTSELIAKGIPDAAYDPIEGDDKAVAAALKKRNRAERDQGQLSLGEEGLELPIAELATAVRGLETIDQDAASGVREMSATYASLLATDEYRQSRTALDAWCAAFVSTKTESSQEFTTSLVRQLAGGAQLGSHVQTSLVELVERHRFFHWPIEFPDVLATGGFDVVVGNPPWGASVMARTKSLLKARLETVRRGTLDTFVAFTQQDCELTRAGGGVGLVLPDIVLLKNYPDIRYFLLTNTAIQQIVHWGQAFAGASIDVCTIAVRVSPPAADHLVDCVADAADLGRAQQINQAVFLANKEYRFNLSLSPGTMQILGAMRGLGPRVGELFIIREGVHSGNVRDRLFIDFPDGDQCKPLIFGRGEIRPMQLEWAGRYIQLDSSRFDRAMGDYYNLGDQRLYAADKILVRRTGDFLLAAPDLSGLFCSNNFFILIPAAEMPTHRLLYAAALLNSRFATAYFRLIQPRKGKLFAELKITHLEEIPLPFFGDPDADQEGCELLATAPTFDTSLAGFDSRLNVRIRSVTPAVASHLEVRGV